MSQEKVDRYKKEKANREKIMRRERWTGSYRFRRCSGYPDRLVLRCCLPELGSREKGEPHERNHNDERDGYSELSERD